MGLLVAEFRKNKKVALEQKKAEMIIIIIIIIMVTVTGAEDSGYLSVPQNSLINKYNIP